MVQASPAPQQVAAAWLDGAGAAFAKRLTTSQNQRHDLTWQIQQDNPVLAGSPIRLVLPRAFPAEPARIYVDRALCALLPHVEEDGRVCLGVEVRPGDYDNPCDAIRRAIEAFQVVLDRGGDAAWVSAELQRERLSYWRRFVARRRQSNKRHGLFKPAYVSMEAFQTSAEGTFAAYEDGTSVASFGDVNPNLLARKHGLAKGTLRFGRVLYVAMGQDELWTPSTWPTSLQQLDALAVRLTGGLASVKAWFADIDAPDVLASSLVVLVQGTIAYGYQVFPATLPKVTQPSIEPITVSRIDANWALARDHQPDMLNERRSKRVLVFGCGALGSPVVELLARAGVGDIDLVDPEAFETENCARHILGMSAVGRSKSVALAERISREVPGVTVYGVPALASAWVMDRCQPGDYDLVVDCTGEAAVRILLGHEGERAFGDTPVVHAWLEPYCAAAHVVAAFPPDRWPDSDPADQNVNAAEWPPDTRVELQACASGFHPYGAADAWQAAGLLAARLLDILDGVVTTSTIWSWVRGRRFFDSLPGAVAPRAVVPTHASGLDAVTITRTFADVVTKLD